MFVHLCKWWDKREALKYTLLEWVNHLWVCCVGCQTGLYLYLPPRLCFSTANGGIHKVLQTENDTFLISEYRPFDSHTHIGGFFLHPPSVSNSSLPHISIFSSTRQVSWKACFLAEEAVRELNQRSGWGGCGELWALWKQLWGLRPVQRSLLRLEQQPLHCRDTVANAPLLLSHSFTTHYILHHYIWRKV